MKRLMVTVALALIAVPAFAAIEYEFVQKNTTDDAVTPITDLTARAILDGTRTRVDFLGGNGDPPGTYVVSTDSSQRLFFVDPAKQWYTEFNTAHAATALASSDIKISNLKSDVRKFDDRPDVAGISTDHYRLSMSYDITLTIRGIALKQRVTTDIDRWTTKQFVGVDAFGTNAMRTGNPEIDQVVDAESGKIPGFVMRQTVTTKTSFDAPKRRSELKVPTQRTIVREMWVTKVKEIAPNANLFNVPASYRRADHPEEKAMTQVTLEPASN
ncbi:MAG: hypothetical protein ACTHQM_24705 [Thermoanaerobaculia bacterium]